jgi:hypothetical protein
MKQPTYKFCQRCVRSFPANDLYYITGIALCGRCSHMALNELNAHVHEVPSSDEDK